MPRIRLNQAIRDLFGLPVEPGDETVYIDDRYRVLRRLGEGAFSTVLLCADERKRGQLVAIKGVRTFSGAHQHSIMHEFVNARRLRHANLVSVIDTGICRTYGIYVAVEYVDGPDLVTILEREDILDVEVAAEICRQVARGLGHMHRHGLTHRDVKPDNVFLEGMHAKLGDFGASRAASVARAATVIYTPGYASPETTQGEVGIHTDAYALGALFHLAVTGKLPGQRSFRATKPAVLAAMRSRGGARADQLVRRLLAPNKSRRLVDMNVIQARFKALVKPGARRRLKDMVERANLKRDRAELEKRWAEFDRRFATAFKPFRIDFVCVHCRGPVSEAMLHCPWCAELLRFRSDASYPRYCERCDHGMHTGWAFCAWCGRQYLHDLSKVRPRRGRDRRYEDRCSDCRGPMSPYMTYCPWCGQRYTWQTRGMETDCRSCGYGVEKNLFGYCPWCGDELTRKLAAQGRERLRALRRR